MPLAVIAQTADALEEFSFRSELGKSVIMRQPVGVVAAITPWNLPGHRVVVKIVPALAAGATVVLKPAELTPLSAFELARAIVDAGAPPGVCNPVPGSGEEIGRQLTRHPGVDQVSFTGSMLVGRQVAAAAAETVKRVTLELGGKSASVVLSDVDDSLLASAVKVTVADCYLNGGQTCTALSRLIVPADRVEQVETLAAAAAEKYTPGGRLGPLISAGQRKDVLSFLRPDAIGGAKLMIGCANGSLPEGGYYVTPTAFSRVDRSARIAREEIFGPVLSVFSAASDGAAIELANDTIDGLGGAIWSGDRERALDAAERIDSGQVNINGAAFNPGGALRRVQAVRSRTGDRGLRHQRRAGGQVSTAVTRKCRRPGSIREGRARPWPSSPRLIQFTKLDSGYRSVCAGHGRRIARRREQ